MSYADNLRLRYLTSDEAVAKRRARAAARAAARNEVDRLAERARKIALWREHAKINRQFEPVSGCWAESLYRNPVFLRLLLPSVAGMMKARRRAKEAAWAADMAAAEQRHVLAIAARKAAAGPQPDLFGGAA